MTRTHYRNGDEISLSCGCDGCSPSMINGTLCHEHGCSEAWRDYRVECFECGDMFFPESRDHRICQCCVEWLESDPPIDDEEYCSSQGI